MTWKLWFDFLKSVEAASTVFATQIRLISKAVSQAVSQIKATKLWVWLTARLPRFS